MNQHEQAVVYDQFDALVYADASGRFPALHDLREQNLPQGRALTRDLYWSFHQRAPVIREAEQMRSAYRLNHQIMREIVGTREWRDLRAAGTPGDDVTSAMATVGTARHVLSALDDQTRDMLKRAAQREEKAQQLFTDADVWDDLAAQFPEQAEVLTTHATLLRGSGETHQDEADRILETLTTGNGPFAPGGEGFDQVRRAARVGLAEATAEVEEVDAATTVLTGGGVGRERGLNRPGLGTDQKLALARQLKNSPGLKQIAELAGRLTRIAQAVQEAKVEHQPSEVQGVEQGNDPARLLPAELALLSDPDLEPLFYARFAERTLGQWKLTGSDRIGRGPVIVAIDESASMAGQFGSATRTAWAKAVALALLAVATAERREFVALSFASAGDLAVWRFPVGQPDPSRAVELAAHDFHGGTDYTGWMTTALALIGESAYNRADVILLSDGLAEVNEATYRTWQETRRAREMRAYAVLIGDRDEAGEEVLTGLTDLVLPLRDLADETQVTKTIFAV